MHHVSFCLFFIFGSSVTVYAIPARHYAHISRRFHIEMPSLCSIDAPPSYNTMAHVQPQAVKREVTDRDWARSAGSDASGRSTEEKHDVGDGDVMNLLSHSDPDPVDGVAQSTPSLPIQPALAALPAQSQISGPKEEAVKRMSKAEKGEKRRVATKGKKRSHKGSTRRVKAAKTGRKVTKQAKKQ